MPSAKTIYKSVANEKQRANAELLIARLSEDVTPPPPELSKDELIDWAIQALEGVTQPSVPKDGAYQTKLLQDGWMQYVADYVENNY